MLGKMENVWEMFGKFWKVLERVRKVLERVWEVLETQASVFRNANNPKTEIGDPEDPQTLRGGDIAPQPPPCSECN